jgi:hypothetical protein
MNPVRISKRTSLGKATDASGWEIKSWGGEQYHGAAALNDDSELLAGTVMRSGLVNAEHPEPLGGLLARRWD